jgi:uncharacterized membrane protein YqaE (UPF0057 family)
VLAILLPPLAVLLCGRADRLIVSVVLTLLFWIPGAIHAVWVVADTRSHRSERRVADAIRRKRR